MTRGNQREIDRARAQARAGKGAAAKKDDGLTPQQRNERDAKAMAEKRAKKAAAASDAGGKAASGPAPAKKKVEKKADDLSSLLSEGLKKPPK